MADTKIEWTNKVWNPCTGCSKISAGCKNCYAETIAKRFWGERKFTDVQCHEDRLSQPLHWKKPAKIFVNSMSDLFHENVPFDFIDEVFHTIAFCPKHIFQILTKRPLRMLKYFSQSDYCVGIEHIKNVWLGVSVEDQQTANERIALLLKMPAAVRFVSCEPLLSSVSFRWAEWQPISREHSTNHLDGLRKLDWVICGGESGPKARPMHPDWARSLRDQCKEAKVPFFFKQWGQYIPSYQAGYKCSEVADYRKTYGQRWVERCHHFEDGLAMVKVGKTKAGRLLDGVEHNEFPEGVVNVTE